MVKTIQKTIAFIFLTISVNLITLQKILVTINRKKNKKRIIYNMVKWISYIQNICLTIALNYARKISNT